MEINWFTVIAQIFNFLILVWLMKKYLYKPILKAIDIREMKIAADLEDAKEKVTQAKEKREEYVKKKNTFEENRKEMMNQVKADVEKERQKLLVTAQSEAAALQQELADSSKKIQKDLNEELVRTTQQKVFSITKKVLAELASTSLERQAVQVFVRRIKSLQGNDKKRFCEAFHSGSSPFLVRSAFELAEQEQQSIINASATIVGNGGHYDFETDAKMILGLELTASGYKLSWSISSYIDSLERSVFPSTEENQN